MTLQWMYVSRPAMAVMFFMGLMLAGPAKAKKGALEDNLKARLPEGTCAVISGCTDVNGCGSHRASQRLTGFSFRELLKQFA